ncbi:unnamed protein product [Prunus armeniaca]
MMLKCYVLIMRCSGGGGVEVVVKEMEVKVVVVVVEVVVVVMVVVVDQSVNFVNWTVRAQEEPANEPYSIEKMWKSSLWSILRFMIPSLLEEVMQVLAA